MDSILSQYKLNGLSDKYMHHEKLDTIYTKPVHVKCDNSKIAKINSELFKKLDGEYYQITKIKDKELLFVYLGSIVNKCGVLLKKNKKSGIYSQYFSTHEICNFKITNNIVISSYKDKGKWFYKRSRYKRFGLK